ncbi:MULTISPECIES: bifunctional phosphopantothenoylcysteine decarboxylase/phosphopantothenate--cysteine ligase CoaBC [unclassified Sphingomonas]|uniref:bifunctional phosphopantothenoylcysteine decarboxylase/phosphopantothenate--cysteine ligase CoaBC n=1 Tax=unclassified Sphingomonas TaxID=196159 RepID=UPI0006FCB8F0|nr:MULTISPECIES: bifunctional phosphopantothenoylcysteine decarboxylase/phosphopantothenate--cysteine ligase CoaBC [unclassified Sphingomonas]KQS49163.1 bifunctional phosphopantothenoylcysteine decarboxylase/phosphopantothenate synthase [Sphingomonas sp. Leaf198]RMB54067.1 phosphopantothenate-cysteine ligase /phosphopantothenoylcysteine decarboxylase [Sphingomonas sp. PP-CE-3A-406]
MKRILLIVGGGIAAYKAAELIRLLKTSGHAVRCVMTEAAHHFVTPMTLAALSEDKVYTTLWDLKDEAEMGHIQLSREADLIVVAPATADLIARMATGMANDLATTLLLATDTPVLVAPAMNVRMWQHAATVRNVAQLRADGITVLQPDEGMMACGEFGPGRLPEPPAIAAAVQAMLAPPRPLRLSGRRILVTAGPTHEPIDPVRYIANRSSGKQGFAIAAALADLGARVTLVAGPVTLPTPAGVDRIDVETARQMASAVDTALPVDAAVMVAAVADWHVDAAPQKIKKNGATPLLSLAENPDILATLAHSPQRPRLVIGFAAETENVIEHATAKRLRKSADWIVANDVSGDVMGGADNSVHLVTATGVESWERLPKDTVAARLADRIADALEPES